MPSPVRPRTLIGVALVSAALLMTELSLTRIFSVTMYYHFAFMAISIALFGLSASGVYVFLMRDRWRDTPTERLLVMHTFAFAVATAIALAVLVRMRIGLTQSAGNVALMSALYLLSALPFFTGGAAITIAITRLAANITAVYAADLLGASAGCLLLMPALNVLGAPNAIVAAAAIGGLAATLFDGPAVPKRMQTWLRVFIVTLILLSARGFFDVSSTKGHENHPVLFSKWNSFSRIGVYDQPYGAWSLSTRYTGPLPDSRLMDIDSAAGTQIIRFSGDLASVSYLQYELTALGYRLFGTPVGAPIPPKPLGEGGPVPPKPSGEGGPVPPKPSGEGGFQALAIGTGGGRDLLSALVFGAARVDGVEINPIIVNDVMRQRFRDYSGGVYDRPDVRVTVEDGRSFVRRSTERYDVIQASLVDTWAATAAGAYSLSENSLYTVEAFEDYLDHLTDRGVLSVSRWVFDGLRLVSLAQEVGAKRGWNAADRIAIVQGGQVATFLLKKTPFTESEIDTLEDAAQQLGFPVLYLPGRTPQPLGDNRDDYGRLLRAPDRQAFYRDYPLDVTPTTDDRPFFFHTTKLRNHAFIRPLAGAFGLEVDRAVNPGAWATGGLTALLVLLAISSTLIVLFIVGPLALTSKATLAPGWPRVLAYFACLGGAFMLIEVALLQRFVLLLGHPVYSLTVTLFSLLVGTGLGSMLSRRASDATLARTAALACLAVAAIALVWGNALPYVVRAAVGWPLALRIALAAGLMVPAGLVMGIPLPTGVRIAAARQPQLVPWAWGMNGALSVLGATVAVFVAMNWGFSVTLLCGAVTYACAAVLIWRR